MRFSLIAPATMVAASLLPTAFGVGGGGAPAFFPTCHDADGPNEPTHQWWSLLEIPRDSNPAYFHTYYTKKLDNHNVLFEITVDLDSVPWITISNGHGDSQRYRVTFKDKDLNKIKSFLYKSNSGKCRSATASVPAANVKHVYVEMVRGA